MLGITAGICLLSYYHFGFPSSFIHYWEQFHYQLTSKYFQELGYDGLYAASIEAQYQIAPDLPLQAVVRDLRNNELRSNQELEEFRHQVVQRFSPERWQEFVLDHSQYLLFIKDIFGIKQSEGDTKYTYLAFFDRIRQDHGFNASPTWVFVAKMVSFGLPTEKQTLFYIASLDIVLILFMFFMMMRSYGFYTGCISMIIFSLGYGWHYHWVGGAFLRFDWLAAVVISICMLKKNHYALAGLLLSYAVMVRLFPLIFLFGIIVKIIQSRVTGKNLSWGIRFAKGFFIGLLLFFLAGCFAGRGVNAWKEFALNTQKHYHFRGTNHAGLQLLCMYDNETLEGEPGLSWNQHMEKIRNERSFLITSSALFVVGLLTLALKKVEIDEAMGMGIVVIFALTQLACYYWGMLLLISVRKNYFAVIINLLYHIGLYSLLLKYTLPDEILYGVLMSSGILLTLSIWILPDCVLTIQEARSIFQFNKHVFRR